MAKGEEYYFIVSLGELHIIKLYCLLACLIIQVILVVLEKKKKKSENPEFSKM